MKAAKCVFQVPYSITKDEVHQLLFRHGSPRQPHREDVVVHVIMERSTAKTMDCFVEVRDKTSVVMTLQRHEHAIAHGRHQKVGPRHIGIELSDQDELLTNLFRRAKCIAWSQGVPVVVANDDPYSSGFNGFVTREEMLGLLRHAEMPQRSPFAVKCVYRTFECMISTLGKFPWFAHELYTLNDRQMLFDAYIGQLAVLVFKVAEEQTVGLNNKLLGDFVRAGLKCPGFGPRMKAAIVDVANHCPADCHLTVLASAWPFEVISPKHEADDNVTAVCRPYFSRFVAQLTLNLQFYLYLIEGGIQVHLSRQQGIVAFPYDDYIEMVLPYKPRPFPFDPRLPHLTKFHFKVLDIAFTYGNAVAMESGLLTYFLKLGWDKWQYEHRVKAPAINTHFDPPERPDLLADAQRRLGVVDMDSNEINDSAAPTPRAVRYQRPRADSAAESIESPSQSPKGTVMPDTVPFTSEGLQGSMTQVHSSANRSVDLGTNSALADMGGPRQELAIGAVRQTKLPSRQSVNPQLAWSDPPHFKAMLVGFGIPDIHYQPVIYETLDHDLNLSLTIPTSSSYAELPSASNASAISIVEEFFARRNSAVTTSTSFSSRGSRSSRRSSTGQLETIAEASPEPNVRSSSEEPTLGSSSPGQAGVQQLYGQHGEAARTENSPTHNIETISRSSEIRTGIHAPAMHATVTEDDDEMEGDDEDKENNGFGSQEQVFTTPERVDNDENEDEEEILIHRGVHIDDSPMAGVRVY